MGRDDARDRNERVPAKQRVAKDLLSRTRNAWPQPVWVRHLARVHDMNPRWIDHCQRRQDMRHGVERFETRVHRDLEDRRRRIDRAVDRAQAPAVPAAPGEIGALTAVPARTESRLIQPPRYQFGAAQARRQRRQV